jgi:hypothetical protein
MVNGIPAEVSNGQWQLTGFDLGDDGISSLVITGTNCGGSGPSFETHLDLDTLAPEITIDKPATGSVTGSATISVGGQVHDAHLTGVEVNGVTADIDGDRFSATITLGNEGSNDITAIATDELDRSTSDAVVVILDTTLPSVTVDTPADGLVTTDTEILVAGTASDSNLAGVTIFVNDAPGLAANLDGESFSHTVTIPEEGVNQVKVIATDQAGNPSPPTTVTVVRDTLPPVITVDSELPLLTSDTEVTVSGTVSDPHLDEGSCQVLVNIVAFPATVSNGEYTVTVPLEEGANQVEVVAADTLGHPASLPPISITRDTTAPTVRITAPADGAQLNTRVITVSGTASDPHLDRVTVNGFPVQPGPDGSFELAELELPEGDS